jgi:hypothetical protein
LTSSLNNYIKNDDYLSVKDLDSVIKSQYIPIETSILRKNFDGHKYSQVRIVSRPEGLFSFRLSREHVSYEDLFLAAESESQQLCVKKIKHRLELMTSLYRIFSALPTH